MLLASVFLASAQTTTNIIWTDSTWRCASNSLVVPSNWLSSVVFDDSNAAGWTNAYQVSGSHSIWLRDNHSSNSPARVRFRHVFEVTNEVTAAIAHVTFDDDGAAYINGTRIISDTGGGSTTRDVIIDPGLFHLGSNLIAATGTNTIAPFNVINIKLTLYSGTVLAVSNAPVSQMVPSGNSTLLSVSASGIPPIFYQWFFNDAPLVGRTNATCPIRPVDAASVGLYRVEVSNTFATVSTTNITVSTFDFDRVEGVPTLSIAGPAGANYRIDYRNRLTDAWQELTTFSLIDIPTTLTDPGGATATNRFYRAVNLP